MPAALARAGLRCCDGQSVLISGNSGGAVSGGTGTISTSGTRHPRAGLDEPAHRDRLGRADRVERAGAIVSEQLHHQARQVARVNDLDRLLPGRRAAPPGRRGRPAAPSK